MDTDTHFGGMKEISVPKKRQHLTEAKRRYYQEYRLKHKYGASVSQFDARMECQRHQCGICKTDVRDKPVVDHDHSTGEPRGILCVKCNHLLGAFYDSPRLLFKAIQYLETSKTMETGEITLGPPGAADAKRIKTCLKLVHNGTTKSYLRWMHPANIRENPENPRDHPDEQTDQIKEFLGKHGWLKPLLYNKTTEHLLDGHERLSIALEQGWSLVPVWVVEIPADQEPEVILALDETGRSGTWNPERTRAMIAKLGDTSAAVTKLIAELANREGLAAYIERTSAAEPTRFATETTPDGSVDPGIAARAMSQEPPSISASRIRLVQLFVDADRLDLFNEWVEDLQEMWGVESVTDAVMRTLSDAHLAYLRGGRRRRS